MNVGKALRAALDPRHWRALANGVVPAIEHGAAFGDIVPATVIDVGANKGQFAAFAARRWPRARIISFEPLDPAARRYRRVMGDRATLLRCALGERADTLDIHVASRADSSSLLPLGDRQKRLFSMREVGVQRVAVERLDTVIAPLAPVGPTLLKIDVQGFEYEVLRGLGSLAADVRWVYVEVSFVELYRGQKLFPEVAALLNEQGYREVLQVNPMRDQGVLVQADTLFERA